MMQSRSTGVRLVLVAAALCLSAACDAPSSGAGGAEGLSLFLDNCSQCHGAYAQGTDLAPAITEVAMDLSEDDLVDIILNGEGQMEPVDLDVEEAELIALYLADELLEP